VIGLAVVFALGVVFTGQGDAQQTGKIPRLCFLTFDPSTPQTNRTALFFQGLRDLGYVHDKTIHIDYLSADGRNERFPTLAAKCVRLKADVVVVSTTPGNRVR
jgi:putative tryptophan/tyrosine transport system substrate-binding protein